MDERFDEFDRKRARMAIEAALQNLEPAEYDRIRDISMLLAEEMAEGEEPGNAVLFCGSDGNLVVKGYHYPAEALGCEGPVILPNSNAKVIYGAYSDELIQMRSDEIKNFFADREQQNEQWEIFLNACAIELSQLASAQPVFELDYSKLLEE